MIEEAGDISFLQQKMLKGYNVSSQMDTYFGKMSSILTACTKTEEAPDSLRGACMLVDWIKYENGQWCKLESLNLEQGHFDNMSGVYVIW